jgi:phytanoyl-CoA hydroxylase
VGRIATNNLTGAGFSEAEVRQFGQEGYVIVRGLADSECCAAMRALAERDLAAETAPLEYEADLQYPGAPPARDAEGGRTVRRLLQAYARAPLFRDWATSAPVAGRVKQLLGHDVLLSQAHHNCVMTKHPRFSSVTGWHRDIRYWSFEREELVSVWLALGAERYENGCLWLIPESHRMEFARERLDNALFLREDVAENQALIASRIEAELDAGDALFFHCRLFHAAGRNQTGSTKFSLVFTYHAAGNRPLPGTRSAAMPDVAL